MKGSAWRPEQVDVVRKHYGTLPVSMIAKAVGRSASAVRNQAAKLGLESGAYRAWTTSDLKLLRARYARDGGIPLAIRMGRTEQAVYRKAADLGIAGVRGNGAWRSRPAQGP